MRYVLFGDAQSPHLLKWARALVLLPPVELWVASSRGFDAGFDAIVPAARRLALNTRPRAAGGNAALLLQLPRLLGWLRQVNAPWLHAHYLTSHGTLAWLAQVLGRVISQERGQERGQMRGGMLGQAPVRLVVSAWGSDVLVAPQNSAVLRMLTRRVLRAAVLSTSDSAVMAQRMKELGADEVMVFPFGLEAMPPAPPPKDDLLFFSNRGLEPIYAPERVLEFFAAVAPDNARLVVANDGSLLTALQARARQLGINGRVQFVGRLDAATQATWYAQARWYLSLPRSDSVAVSVLEAMAQGCVPVLSDLPANREVVMHGENGFIVGAGPLPQPQALVELLPNADSIAARNRHWVEQHALFTPAVAAFVARLRSIAPDTFAA